MRSVAPRSAVRRPGLHAHTCGATHHSTFVPRARRILPSRWFSSVKLTSRAARGGARRTWPARWPRAATSRGTRPATSARPMAARGAVSANVSTPAARQAAPPMPAQRIALGGERARHQGGDAIAGRLAGDDEDLVREGSGTAAARHALARAAGRAPRRARRRPGTRRVAREPPRAEPRDAGDGDRQRGGVGDLVVVEERVDEIGGAVAGEHDLGIDATTRGLGLAPGAHPGLAGAAPRERRAIVDGGREERLLVRRDVPVAHARGHGAEPALRGAPARPAAAPGTASSGRGCRAGAGPPARGACRCRRS